MLIEFYRKDEGWRANAVGQGFNGGLDALIVHFGGEVAPSSGDTQSHLAPPETSPKISLEKRPEREPTPRRSGQKSGHLPRKGRFIQTSCSCGALSGYIRINGLPVFIRPDGCFTDRILALASRLDDDGDLDVFLFGNNVHQPSPMSLSTSQGYVGRLMQQYRLEGGTRYGLAIEAIRKHYFPNSTARSGTPVRAAIPVFVMFVTDGQTSDQDKSRDT